MNIRQSLKRAALFAAVALTAGSVKAGDFSIGININGGRHERETTVIVRDQPVVYETFVVGYRRDLYDADLRLRLARADEFTAYDELQAARAREAQLAATLDDSDALISDLRRRCDGAADPTAIHADVVATGGQCAELRRFLDSYNHRIAAAREDLEASRIIDDRRGSDDAAARMHEFESKSASKSAELREAEGRLAHLKELEARAGAFATDLARLHDAEARRGGIAHDLDIAHDAVFNTQHRWEDCRERVFVAMHDRDEALWRLHRDDILAGRIDLASCGFTIDLSVWGGHLPRDPEVIHAYCVRDVGYIRANPVFIENRATEITKVTEVTKIREITRTREVEKVKVVERVEKTHVPDRHYAEVVATEHKRYEAETVERKTAAAEHRAPRTTTFIEHKTTEKREMNTGLDRAREISQPKADSQSDNSTESRSARARRRAAEQQSNGRS